jgi:hypothetical protein
MFLRPNLAHGTQEVVKQNVCKIIVFDFLKFNFNKVIRLVCLTLKSLLLRLFC